jgi:predicted methyltransferase
MNATKVPPVVSLARILRAVLLAIGPEGAPEGTLYAAMMAQGCTLEQFESIIRSLEKAGLIESRAHFVTITEAGRAWIAATEGV